MPMFDAVAGLLPDIEARAVTLADVPILTDLVRRIAVDATGTPDNSEDEIRDDLVGPRLDLARDSLLMLDSQGRALVYGVAFDEHDERGYVDVYLDPEFDDLTFERIADLAVGAALERLAESVQERSGAGTVASSGLYRGEDRMLAAYRAHGFEPSTTYWRMGIDLDGQDIAPLDVATDVEIRAVDPDDDDVMATALELRNDTFSEHHGHVDMNFTDYSTVWRETSKYDRKGWWFAYQTGVPVGLCLCDEAKLDENAGFVRSLGVRRTSRGRGIARALLLTAFAEYARRGRTSVQLSVDSANDTGATRLYESVGMRTIIAIDTLERKIVVAPTG